jgi:hypothetical protein
MLQIWGHPVKHTSIPVFPQRIETFFYAALALSSMTFSTIL